MKETCSHDHTGVHRCDACPVMLQPAAAIHAHSAACAGRVFMQVPHDPRAPPPCPHSGSIRGQPNARAMRAPGQVPLPRAPVTAAPSALLQQQPFARTPRSHARPSSQEHQYFLSRGGWGGGGTHPLIKNSYYVHLKGTYTVSCHISLACAHAAQARDHRHRSESRSACFTRQIARPHLAVHTGTTLLLHTPRTADRDDLLQAGFERHRQERKGRLVRSCPCYSSRKPTGRPALRRQRMPPKPACQPYARRGARASMHRELVDVRENMGILPVPSTVSAWRCRWIRGMVSPNDTAPFASQETLRESTRLQYETRRRTWSLMRGCASEAMIPHVANLPTGFSINHDGA